ncbi:MAG: ABC transporter ATP-binding protein [Actinomycetota bacterium]
MTTVSVRALSASFDESPVLQGIDLEVPNGQVGVVLGPSGSGKSTLIRAIAGLHRPITGEIWLGQQQVYGPKKWVPPEARGVGLVPQSGSLFPHLTVAENIQFAVGKRCSEQARDRVNRLVEIAELGDFLSRMPHELSGGQKQRVALTRALAHNPAVVLMDEPFSALDAGLREELRDDVMRLLRASGATSVIVTHDQAEALSMADSIAVLRVGVIEQTGSPKELFDRPASSWLATFLATGTLCDALATGFVASTPWGTVHLATPATGPIDVLIRPDRVDVTATSAASEFSVDQCRYYGQYSTIVVRHAPTSALLSVRTNGQCPPPGGRVQIHIRGSVEVFPRDSASSTRTQLRTSAWGRRP